MILGYETANLCSDATLGPRAGRADLYKTSEPPTFCCVTIRLATIDQVDILWTTGAFELSGACAAAADSGRYACLVALGAVIRGETPHFEYVSSAATQGLTAVAVQSKVPIGFGVLTVDSLPQATARAGGGAGNKGYEAAESAIQLADALGTLRSLDA